MGTLLLRHVAGSEPPRFYVERPGGKATSPVEIAAPSGFPVEGRPNSNLVRELRWYLEDFLDYPFPPETEHAERIQAALRAWGEGAFEALFGDRVGGGLLAAASAPGLEALALQVWSDDAQILAWPWEALRDPKASVLAHAGSIERRLNVVLDPAPVPAGLPADRVNILLVIARPKEGDVKYRSISRSLVELIEAKNLPAYVHVLRPPTFDGLRQHLRERPGYYHLVHFDGHGSYGSRLIAGDAAPGAGPGAGPGGGGGAGPNQGPHVYGAPEGALLFEDANGKEDAVRAETLSALLQEHKVPAMVLNACRSAMLGEGDERDPFASVATSLLKAGTRSVVAMSYSLYVSGAQQFLPAFYGRLFESGSFAEAVRAGRQQMLSEPGRVCVRGRFALQDWMVPVVYQQEAEALSFAATGEPPVSRKRLPKEALDGDNPYGLIGRDGAILEIERALRRPVPAILVHGLGGVGKTTLVRGLLEWLAATEGLGEGCVWFSFQEIRSAEYVVNRLGEALFGKDFGAAEMERKIARLTVELKQHRIVIVWDNFEVVAGIKEFDATLSEADRGYLRTFLQRLRGGKTKVLITSRSDEDWLGSEQRRKVELGGLDGEERWALAEAILGDLGVAIDRTDKDLVELMKLLDGHPLAMRVVLPRLEAGKQRAGELCQALRSNLSALGGSEDETLKRLYATLQLAEDVLPEALRPLLVPLGMHERYVDGDYLEAMAKHVDGGWTRDRIDRFLGALASAGLLRDLGQAIHEMHPALTGFLRATTIHQAAAESRESWSRGFVDVMGRLADGLAPRELHEQRVAFHLHSANFYHALKEAERLGMGVHQAALTQGLAAYAQNTRRFSEARALFERLAGAHKGAGNPEGEAAAHHQLGRIAEEQRDFAGAEAWYRQSLAINEKQGNEHDAAISYHQLGMIAQQQRDFVAAETWYRKSLAIKEKQGNEHGAATSYHQLGMIAQEQRDFAAAETWYRKSLAIEEKQGNEHGAATSYHQLGMIAQEQRDFGAAEAWYRKALTIDEKQGNEHGAATSYHQLGMIAQEQRDFGAAEAWYRKALAIKEKQGNEHGAAGTYGQLGMIAQEQRDFGAAEAWYRKALAIFEKQGDEHGAASAHHQLGMTAQEQRDFGAAEAWYRKALAIEEKQGNEHGSALSYGQLGIVAALQEHFEEAGQWFIRCVLTFTKCNDAHLAQRSISNFRLLHSRAPAPIQEKLDAMWQAAGLPKLPPPSSNS